ncbi:MAG: cytochrome c biogenesis protein ResB [Candidatus Baltobacteraceae bacterium]|jgi:cytochrome c biogenesis protein
MASSSAASVPPQPVKGKALELVDELLSQLSNFWFGMCLLALWGVMTLIGVVVDQGKPPEFYLDNYTPALARLVLRLHLDNIYHSSGYIAVVGFIVACMALATFRRVIPSRLPPLRAVKIDKIPLHATVFVKGDEASVRERVERFFAERGWLVRKRELGGVEWTFADKYNWARKGVLMAHVGFVLIATGTTLYWAFGFSGQTTILSGSEVAIPQSGARFKLDQFRYRIDPIKTRSGIVYQPLDYVSEVEVAGKDGAMHHATLRVNHPLDVDGTLYYQASYGFAVPFAVTKDGQVLPNSPGDLLKEGEGFQIGDSARSVQYGRFVGTIGPGGTIGADPRPNAPGVLLNVFDGDQPLGSVLVPLGKGIDLGNGYRVEVGPYRLYSGIQFRHDPGIPFVGLGAFVLLAGLCMSFYFLPARLYVRVERKGDGAPGSERGCEVGLAATTVKGYEIFEERFASLVEALRKSGIPVSEGGGAELQKPLVTSATAPGAGAG